MYIVKRIIGLPGDRIHLRDGIVYRNGQKLDEPYVRPGSRDIYEPYRDNFPAVRAEENANVLDDWKLTMDSHIENGDIVVPPQSYFGMGDNRDVSLDSRYWGFITQEHVIGRPMFIYWSFKTPESQYAQREFTQRVSAFLHTIIHFFDQTRWNRTLKGVR
jgi:signal peptidase I